MKVLYFVEGPWPTAEQKAEAAKAGAVMRNARLASGTERCDAVMGAVPAAFEHVKRFSAATSVPPEMVKPKRRRRTKAEMEAAADDTDS